MYCFNCYSFEIYFGIGYRKVLIFYEFFFWLFVFLDEFRIIVLNFFRGKKVIIFIGYIYNL